MMYNGIYGIYLKFIIFDENGKRRIYSHRKHVNFAVSYDQAYGELDRPC